MLNDLTISVAFPTTFSETGDLPEGQPDLTEVSIDTLVVGPREEWRPIDGHPGYSVSSLGRVVSHPKPGRYNFRILVASLNFEGYSTVNFCGENRRVHRLVCAAFVGPQPTSAHEVAHRDGTRANNVPSNLRWATRTNNQRDRKAHGTSRWSESHPLRANPERLARGEATPSAKLTEKEVAEIFRSTLPGSTLSRAYDVTPAAIHAIRNGKNWRWLTEKLEKEFAN